MGCECPPSSSRFARVNSRPPATAREIGAVDISFLLDDRGSSSPPPASRPNNAAQEPGSAATPLNALSATARSSAAAAAAADHVQDAASSATQPRSSPENSASASPSAQAARQPTDLSSADPLEPARPGLAGTKRPLSTLSTDSAQAPTRKQTKWTPQEDELIIQLRGSGMKWETISKQFPGRSAIACRLHYQNFLERKPAWDEEKKNKLARLYERFKQQMWEPVAKELGMPWRAAEAMHWQLGSEGMASRAGTTPFSSNPSSIRPPPGAPESMAYLPESAFHQPQQMYGAPAQHVQTPPGPYPPSTPNPGPGPQHPQVPYGQLAWPPPPNGAQNPPQDSMGHAAPNPAQSPRDYTSTSSYFQRPRQPSLSASQSYPAAGLRPEYDARRMELPPPPPQYSGPFLKPPPPDLGRTSYQQSSVSPRLPPIRTREDSTSTERQDHKILYGEARSEHNSPPR